MKITKKQLKRIIKEEVEKLANSKVRPHPGSGSEKLHSYYEDIKSAFHDTKRYYGYGGAGDPDTRAIGIKMADFILHSLPSYYNHQKEVSDLRNFLLGLASSGNSYAEQALKDLDAGIQAYEGGASSWGGGKKR